MRLWLVIFSAGWLLPFTLSIWGAYDFLWRIVWPVAAHDDWSNVATFHIFEWSDELLYVSIVWLGAVITFWVLKATKRPRH